MPEPFASPVIRQGVSSMSTTVETTLGTVSVVIIAVAAWAQWSVDSWRASASIPLEIWSMGSRRPMVPVEETHTSLAEQPMACAVRAAMLSVSRTPCSPVQALALPLFTTTARLFPLATRSRHQVTQLAWTRFAVKVPARAAERSETRSARSGFRGFTPQWSPPAENPAGRMAVFSRVVFESGWSLILTDPCVLFIWWLENAFGQ